MVLAVLSVVAFILSVVAFILAIVQTSLAIRQTRESRKLEEDLKTQRDIMVKASGRVVAQGELLRGQVESQHKLLEAANNQTEAMQNQVKQTEEIRRALPTRFLKVFPEFLPEVVSLIKKARKEIVVFCDIPAYACFSSPDNHLDYRQAIEQKINERRIRMELMFLSEDWREKAQAEQFKRDAEACAEWSVDKREKLKEFLARYPKRLPPAKLSLNPEDLSKTEYFSLANNLNQLSLELFANAAPTEIDATMPVIFWLVDDEEAVFAIPAYDEESPTLGFKTSDRDLIRGLKKISKSYRKDMLNGKSKSINIDASNKHLKRTRR